MAYRVPAVGQRAERGEEPFIRRLTPCNQLYVTNHFISLSALIVAKIPLLLYLKEALLCGLSSKTSPSC